MSQHDDSSVVIGAIGFDVIRNDHRDRIMSYCRATQGANYALVLGLYVHMASKPNGWRFSYRRLAWEMPGVGEKAIRTALRHLEALGYYCVTNKRGDDGQIRGSATFDAGNTWPAQTPAKVPLQDVGHSSSTQSDETTTETVRHLPEHGAPQHGGARQSVNTGLPSTEKSQSQGPPDLTSPRDSKPKPASDEQTAFLDELSRLTDCTYTRHGYALTQAQTAIELGHDAASAVDELRSRGHNLRRVGPGFILKQLPTLTYKPAPSTAAGHALITNVLGDAFAMA